MTEAIGRGIIKGIEAAKPELLELILEIGKKGEDTLSQLTEALIEGRLLVKIGSETVGNNKKF